MGRRIPLANDQSIYPALSLSFFLAGMAAVIAISTTLCGIRFGRKSESKSSKFPSQQNVAENLESNNSTSPSPTPSSPPLTTATTAEIPTTLAPPPRLAEESQDREVNEIPQIKELPLPPAKQLTGTYSTNHYRTKSASLRDLTVSLSMKLPRSLSLARNHDREDKTNQKKKGKLKHEDSVWMKTIILGEKCKVPDEEEAVIYDGKGNRISTYHPKASISRTVSRQSSHIDLNAVPSVDKVTRKGVEEELS